MREKALYVRFLVSSLSNTVDTKWEFIKKVSRFVDVHSYWHISVHPSHYQVYVAVKIFL